MKYEPFDTDEIPAELMAQLEERAARAEIPELRPDGRRILGIPQIPNVQMPNVAGIIQNVLKSVPRVNIQTSTNLVTDDPFGTHGVEEVEETLDLPPDAEISINHLKGDISIQGWEEARLEYGDLKGNVELDEGVVRIESSGDCSLKVPRNAALISLKFVSSNASISDVAASLTVSGVKGKANIASAGVPEGATLSISMVSGDIDMSIPEDASFSISAQSLSGGEISCDLPLQDEERTRTQLSGILNDGTAEIVLNTVKGNISISLTEVDAAKDEDEIVEDEYDPEVKNDE